MVPKGMTIGGYLLRLFMSSCSKANELVGRVAAECGPTRRSGAWPVLRGYPEARRSYSVGPSSETKQEDNTLVIGG